MKHIYGTIITAIIIFSLSMIADFLGFNMHNHKLFILIGVCYFIGLVAGCVSTAIIYENRTK